MTNTELNYFATNLFTEFVKKISVYDLQTKIKILISLIELLQGLQLTLENTVRYNSFNNENLFLN
jgi:hypothetical protein